MHNTKKNVFGLGHFYAIRVYNIPIYQPMNSEKYAIMGMQLGEFDFNSILVKVVSPIYLCY